jgi:hypothetical protein
MEVIANYSEVSVPQWEIANYKKQMLCVALEMLLIVTLYTIYGSDC